MILDMEQATARAALITIALSRSDADYIAQHHLPADTQANSRLHVRKPFPR